MVTRIELGSYRIDRSIKNGHMSEVYVVSPETRLVGEIPDMPGTYDIDGGIVKMGLRIDENGHRLVDLDLKNSELGRFLKGEKERSVCISNTGEGRIFLPKRKVLFVRTDAAPENFALRKKGGGR